MQGTSHKANAIIAVLAIVVTVIMVRLLIQQPSDSLPVTEHELVEAAGERHPGLSTPIGLLPLKQARKQGSRFICSVIGRLEGTMTQVAKVDVVIPILEGEIRSKWIAPWLLQHTTEIVRNDGNTLVERQQFKTLRRVELMAPATVSRLDYSFDLDVQKAISSVASNLLQGSADDSSGMVLLQSEALGFAGISQLTGIDEAVLEKQKAMLTATASILDEVEGVDVELRIGDGHAEWHHTPDLPANVAPVLHRLRSLIDYTALPEPNLEIGDEAVLEHLNANSLFPSDLVSPWFGHVDTKLTLILTRRDNRAMQGRSYAVFEGHGRVDLLQPDGTIETTFDIQSASLLVDHTEPDTRFLHSLQIATPISTLLLSKQPGYRDVQWDGDLNLRLLYQVDFLP